MGITYHCSHCDADLSWRLYRAPAPRLARCPHCGVDLEPGSVERVVRAIHFGGGFALGWMLGMLLGVLVTGLSEGRGWWAGLGIGLAVWAACFVWHDLRARRAVGRPGTLFGALARWSALAVALPGAVAALVNRDWLFSGPGKGMNYRDLVGGFMCVGIVTNAIVAWAGTAFYLRRKRVPARTSTKATEEETRGTRADQAQRSLPPPPKQVSERELLEAVLLGRCHGDTAMLERLLDAERAQHPNLGRTDLLELAIEHFVQDNR
jgi:hypothetical protein